MSMRRRGRKPREWTEEELADLRKMRVADFCAKHKLTKSAAYSKRVEIGLVEIPRQWTLEMDAVLRELPPKDAARLLKISETCIRSRLKVLGKRPVVERQPPKVTYTREYLEAMLAKYGTATAVAAKMGVSRQRVSELLKREGVKIKKG